MLFYRMPFVFIILFCCFMTAPALSDSLVIPDISTQPQNAPDSAARPARAMTMDQVRDQFGAPMQVVGPVGNPPITRWFYGKFIVTFESEYVIHYVAKSKQ